MDFLNIFYPAEKAFPFKTPIFHIKHLPMDLGHQEGPKGEKMDMRLFWLSFYIYCWHLHIQKNGCTLYNQTFSIHYLYLLWVLDSLVVPEAPEKVIKK